MQVVVKIGGSILQAGAPDLNLVNDIKAISTTERLVLVHGGGDEVTQAAEKMGKQQVFTVSPEGFRSRYTDKETLEIYVMVMAGKINKEIVATLRSFQVPAFGVSGVDGGLLTAERKKRLISIDERGRKRIIEGGYTGRITAANVQLLRLLMENGYLPIVAPLALSQEYEILNVDGDRTAAFLAGALGAEKLVFLTDVKALILDGQPVPRLTMAEAQERLSSIGPGMITKVYAALEALKMGVKEAIITSGLKPQPITSAVTKGSGTVITP
ncbi:MAG: [LysW]-aminoadipate/[LysW]-glutamate kinase [Candidatus Bathyarchaeia archaeon]